MEWKVNCNYEVWFFEPCNGYEAARCMLLICNAPDFIVTDQFEKVYTDMGKVPLSYIIPPFNLTNKIPEIQLDPI